jgi:hypothetical protein
MLGNDDTGRWLSHVAHGDFTRTVLSLLGAGHGWGAIAPFALLIAVAVYAVVRATAPQPVARPEVLTAGAALAAWALLGSVGRPLLRTGIGGELGLIVLATAAVLAVLRIGRRAPSPAPIASARAAPSRSRTSVETDGRGAARATRIRRR